MDTTVNFIATVELDLTPDELTELKRLSEMLNKPLGTTARECMMEMCRARTAAKARSVLGDDYIVNELRSTRCEKECNS
jgi:hypothetical protein